MVFTGILYYVTQHSLWRGDSGLNSVLLQLFWKNCSLDKNLLHFLTRSLPALLIGKSAKSAGYSALDPGKFKKLAAVSLLKEQKQ